MSERSERIIHAGEVPHARTGEASREDAGLDDWRMLAQGIHARFTTGSFATGLALVAAIGERGGGRQPPPRRHPDLPRVDVTLSSHDVGHVTQRDLDLAAHDQ